MNQTPNANYQNVFTEFCQIYESTVLQFEQAQGRQKTTSYFQMGQQIAAILAPTEGHSRYGKGLVTRLANDMKQKYGKGPSTRTIRYMCKFAKWYQPTQIHPLLSWSHYCVLLTIEDESLRRSFETRAVEEQLSRSQLQQLVSLSSNSNAPLFPLTPRQARPHIAKVVWPNNTDGPMLDIGFGIEYKPRTHALQKLPPKSHVIRTTDGRYRPIACQKGERYCYRGELIDVIDGDTVKMRLQLTPTIAIKERFRLRGVEAMEINTPEGQRAKHALAGMLNNQTDITVYTYHTDRYGRYIADLNTPSGLYVNKELVEKGHARFLKMGS